LCLAFKGVGKVKNRIIALCALWVIVFSILDNGAYAPQIVQLTGTGK